MLKNLKIDIIYYNTPSDFEFEFNLGGYCRSRILNAKANGLKELLTKLAIAVTRSRVIIIVGELLGDNGCIAPVSKAISKPLATVDHHQYHITSPEPISIIEGSLPLVNSNGEFGGCIIESGPQSIVFLSEDKALRSNIEKELLSHYLTTLSMTSDEENEVINTSETVTQPEQEATVELPSHEENALETNETENIEEDESKEISEEIIAFQEIETVEEQTKFDSEEIIEETPEEIINEVSSDEDTNEEFKQVDICDNNDSEMAENDDTEEDLQSTIFSNSIEHNVVFDNEYLEEDGDEFDKDDYLDETETNKKERSKKPLSALSKTLLVLCAVLFVVIAVILYFTVYLPGLDGVSVFEFFERVFSLIKIL